MNFAIQQTPTQQIQYTMKSFFLSISAQYRITPRRLGLGIVALLAATAFFGIGYLVGRDASEHSPIIIEKR